MDQGRLPAGAPRLDPPADAESGTEAILRIARMDWYGLRPTCGASEKTLPLVTRVARG